ncbi:MAG: hypothetical protein M9955_23090 [Rhizobiaceae bacterium]|nr:hypothetical protein [Rhizobiaceae bacterium]
MTKTVKEPNANETQAGISRRGALMRLGLAAGALYVAPAMLDLNKAHASSGSGGSGGSGGGGGGRGSGGSRGSRGSGAGGRGGRGGARGSGGSGRRGRRSGREPAFLRPIRRAFGS